MTAPRELPHSPEAERSVVGGVLLYASAFEQVASLAPGDFFHPVLGAIWQAMIDLDAASKPIDTVSVAAQMQASDTYGRLKAHGGEAYFADLMGDVVTVENLAYHADIVAEMADRRRAIEAGTEAVIAAREGEEGWRDGVEAGVLKALERRKSSTATTARDLARRIVASVEERHENRGKVQGVPTGFAKLDEMTTGLRGGDLFVLAARPAMGKTSLALNVVEHAAYEHKIPCLVFSLEMTDESLGERMIASDGRIDAQALRTGDLTRADWQRFSQAVGRFSQAPIVIEEQATITMREIRARSRRWRKANPSQHGLIVLDYLQLVDPRREKGESQTDAIGRISRGLKALAKELRVPVVALSQLNREVEKRKSNRPTLADLRDSGAIEQDADAVAFIYRDEVYNPQTKDRGLAEVIIAKQRSGPTGTVRLSFLGDHTRFEDRRDEGGWQPSPPPRAYAANDYRTNGDSA